jgi:hypothetical protein
MHADEIFAALLLLPAVALAQSPECIGFRGTPAQLEKCEAYAAKKRQEREGAERARADETAKQNATAIEAAREAIAEERVDAERLDELAKRPGFKADALSAEICVSREVRALIVRELATQHRYGRIVGAVRPAELHQLGRRLRALDEQLATMTSNMKFLKLRAQPCGKPAVKYLMQCVTDVYVGEDETPFEREPPAGVDCTADNMRAALRVMNPPEE